MVRFFCVGTFNTAFGYVLFAILTYVIGTRIEYGYMVANAISNICAIIVAFIAYKFLVFKTKGNYIHEFLRFVSVSGITAVINLALLPILVAALNIIGIAKAYSPYLAGALLTSMNVITSFFGHRNFSFNPERAYEKSRALDLKSIS